MFTDADIISCYTWDDAVQDGEKVDVSRLASRVGYTMPVAITRNLFETHLKVDSEAETDLNINALLMLLAIWIKRLDKKGEVNTNRISYPATFEDDCITQVWACIESRSPVNPEPVMTIMLPSDY